MVRGAQSGGCPVRDRSREQYETDPTFKAFADLAHQTMAKGQLTAEELRRAVMYGAIQYETYTVRPQLSDLGFRVVEDSTMPPGEAELRSGGAALRFKIRYSLSCPALIGRPHDFGDSGRTCVGCGRSRPEIEAEGA
jgi:hypothetical protein